MQLVTGIEAIDLGLYLVKHQTLIFSDFHLGFEESLNRQGVFVPRMHYKDIVARLDLIFLALKEQNKIVKTVVLTGDLKHAFGSIQRQEWKDILNIVDYFHKHAPELVLIKGNHDAVLAPVANKKGITLVSNYRISDILVIHGDVLPAELDGVKTIIMGHEHPAISLRAAGRIERYKCYIVGTYKRRTLIVQPSFNLLVEGSDLLQERLLSPLLTDVSSFNTFIVDEKQKEVLAFGKVKGLK